jgi:transposase
MGIDISDQWSTVCVLDTDGEVMEESRFRSTRAGLGRYLEHRAPMRVVLEVGTHSPWMSRQIEELGHEVFVANPRQPRLPTLYRLRRLQEACCYGLLVA